MNRKNIGVSIGLVGLLFLFFSCASLFSTTKVVETTFDPSHPAELSSKILFWLDVQTYNGVDVHEPWGSAKDNIPLVTIPSGETTIGFTAYFQRKTNDYITNYTINDCVFKYNFEAGKEYTVKWFLERKPKSSVFAAQHYIYHVQIYGKLPKNLKGFNDPKAFNEADLVASIPIFDSEELK